MTERPMTERDLEALFAAGREARAEPDEALLARVMADAMAETEARRSPAAVAAPRARIRRAGLLAGLVAAIGGWPALGGLATAGVVGVWIGYADPVGLDSVTSTMLGSGYGPSDMAPSLDIYLTEG